MRRVLKAPFDAPIPPPAPPPKVEPAPKEEYMGLKAEEFPGRQTCSVLFISGFPHDDWHTPNLPIEDILPPALAKVVKGRSYQPWNPTCLFAVLSYSQKKSIKVLEKAGWTRIWEAPSCHQGTGNIWIYVRPWGIADKEKKDGTK